MTDTTTDAKFIWQPNPNEFRVSIEVRAITWVTVTAVSAEQAREMGAEAARDLKGDSPGFGYIETAELIGVNNTLKMVSQTDFD